MVCFYARGNYVDDYLSLVVSSVVNLFNSAKLVNVSKAGTLIQWIFLIGADLTKFNF